jgi:hypothetical protein
MELRGQCGGSDRSARSTGVWRGIKEAGPVWVVEVRRSRVPQRFAKWCFPTKALAEGNVERAIGHDDNGGVVEDSRVTEGLAYWAESGSPAKRTRQSPQPAYTSLEAMGF